MSTIIVTIEVPGREPLRVEVPAKTFATQSTGYYASVKVPGIGSADTLQTNLQFVLVGSKPRA